MTLKINRLILFAALAFGAGSTAFAFDTAEKPYERAGTATTVSISTSAWTKVPASNSVLSDRAGFYLNVPAANNASVVGVLVPAGGTTPATSVRPLEFAKGTNTFIQAGPNMSLYLMSLHTAAENVHVQELGK